MYAFFAGTVFCFFVVSFVWWSQKRATRKINNVGLTKMDLNKTLDIKKQEEIKYEQGAAKAKEKKNDKYGNLPYSS